MLQKRSPFQPKTQWRYSSYRSSPFVCDMGRIQVSYDVTNDPKDWEYVRRSLKPRLVPEPTPKASYPSEWKPQGDDLGNKPYFVARTKNHMMPVYMAIKGRGERRLTYVKKIQGDIWLLEKELRDFLQKEQVRPIRSQVNEFAGYLCFNGDHVNAIKYYLSQKNF